MLGSLTSRVGRRLVFMFGVCALLPLLGLTTLSYFTITDYLLESSHKELRAGSKSYGMSLLDRLLVLETALQETASVIEEDDPPAPRRALLAKYFQWIGVVDPDGSVRTLIGTDVDALGWNQLRLAREIEENTTLVATRPLLMAVGTSSSTGEPRVVVGTPLKDVLWWGTLGDNTLPASTDMLIVADDEVIQSTLEPNSAEAREAAAWVSSHRSATASGDWERNGTESVTGFWTLPLSLRFAGSDWTIAWTRSTPDVLLPVREFASSFALVLSATFLGVILLALSQIRRFLQPLDKLRTGTQRVAKQDFSTPVQVSSGDEFEDLAGSFNRMTSRLGNVIAELQSHQLGTLRSLARTMDERSPWTLGHSGRVADLCRRMGEVLGLPRQELTTLYRAGLLHDIGKLRLPTELLEKASDLSPREFVQIQEHVEAGVRILAPIPDYASVTPIVAQHHERLNGTGYPRGLIGDEICQGARILAVADSFDALSSDRPYRSRLARSEVLAELHDGARTLYDPEVLAALDTVLGEGGSRTQERIRTLA